MRDHNSFSTKRFHPLKGLFFLLMAALLLALAGYVITFLWNYTLPHLVGARPITFWQSIALFVLFRILVGGFGWRSFKDRARHRGFSKRRYWKEKWMNMDESERAQFKDKWKAYCNKKK